MPDAEQRTLTSVYHFSDYRDYLKAVFETKKRANPRFSYEVWARQLELKSNSSLVMILQGQRNPSSDLTEKLAASLKLNRKERAFFESLVALEKNRKNESVCQLLKERLRSLNPKKAVPMNYHIFKIFSSLLPSALRELVALPDFTEDIQWIKKRLRLAASSSEIKLALESLTAAGLLKRDADKQLSYTEPMQSTFDIPHESIAQFHEHALSTAAKSLRTVPVGDREIAGVTFTVNKNDLPLVKEKIRGVLADVVGMSAPEDSNEVYHLEIACFPLSQKDLVHEEH